MFLPKVSIVIPVYNGANFLREAIDSALAQTYKNIEVIVVNDGSDDDGKTENIALSYGEAVRYLHKENGGVASALNVGIRKAAGEYISWLSHDDLYFPQKVEKQIAALAAMPSPDVILYADYEMIDAAGRLLRTVCFGSTAIADARQAFLTFLFISSVQGCSLLLPKKCITVAGWFDETLRTTQDYDLWFRLLHRGHEFRHVAEPLVKSRIHGEQGTYSMYAVHRQEAERLYVSAVDMFYADLQKLPVKTIVDLIVKLRERRLKQSSNHFLRSIKLHNRALYRQMFQEYGSVLVASRLKLPFTRPLQLIEGTAKLLATKVKSVLWDK